MPEIRWDVVKQKIDLYGLELNTAYEHNTGKWKTSFSRGAQTIATYAAKWNDLPQALKDLTVKADTTWGDK